ncbi:unnamed protein product [Spirodela intermedia]|uniref:Uncharacterized protein n=1 Tax=Spirodela intermedia TaxID=51605 RepID=A0A7I8J9T8_SPIIN|nr:unnamed protein product [Spirodela intermedia]CAA6666986.1 unnamed protein product [Spirodela intermedia]
MPAGQSMITKSGARWALRASTTQVRALPPKPRGAWCGAWRCRGAPGWASACRGRGPGRGGSPR